MVLRQSPSLLPVGLVLILAPLTVAGYDPAISFAFLVFLIAVALLLHKVQQFCRRELSMRIGEQEALWGLFLLCAGASVLSSVNLHASLSEFLRYLSYVMFALAVRKSAIGKDAFRLIVAALVVGSTAASWWGLKQYVEQVWAGAGFAWRIFSTFYNPNLLAGYIELAIFPAFVGFWVARERSWKMLSGFAFALNFAALLMTGSKGGAMAVAFAAVLMALAWKIASPHSGSVQWKGWLVYLLLIGIVAALAGRPLILRLLAAGGDQANSSQFRWLLWKSTCRIIRDHPFTGTGIGTFESIYPRYAIAGFTRMAHENYLQLAAEGGTAMAAVFVLLLVSSIVLALRLVRSAEREISLWSCGLLGSLLAFAIHGLVDYTWYVPAIALGAAACLAMVSCLRDLNGPAGSRLRPGRMVAVALATRGSLQSAAVLVVAFLGVVVYAQCRLSMAASAHQTARVSMRNPAQAMGLAEQSVRLAPRAGAYHARLGNLLFARYQETGDAGDRARAEQAYRLAIACEPTAALQYFRLAKLRQWDGDWSAAEACLRSAVRWNPNYTDALLGWGTVEEKQGRKDAAREHYERIVVISGSPVELYKAVPDLYDQNYILASLALGKLALGDRRYDQSRREFDRALHWTDLYLNSANALLNGPADPSLPDLGPPKSVIKQVKAEVLAWKAKSHLAQGHRKEANDLINQALDTDPGVAGLISEVIKRNL
ncbi:MAG: O-antigen ligase family protein [Armatimonadetes bacterium]|nr:O-antigen ligase family protein [Armatimonadota bacterium]